MSRSGYVDDYGDGDQWAMIRWRGAVASATKGKRGQTMLIELRDALDAMPEKLLITNALEADGEFCALGVLGAKRGIDLQAIDPDDRIAVAAAFGIAEALAAEIMWENDEAVSDKKLVKIEICGPMRPHFPDWGNAGHKRTIWVPDATASERRWKYMRSWVERQIKKEGGHHAE